MLKNTVAHFILISILSIILFASFASHGQEVLSATGPHIKVDILTPNNQFVAGENQVGIYLQPDEDWHTYWRNPGDSGEAPSLIWSVPDDVHVGEITWPVPQQIPVAHLVNYGYEGAVLLTVPITIPPHYVKQTSPLNLSVDLSWLVCKEDCIPGWATLSLSRQVQENALASTHSHLFKQAKKQQVNARILLAKHEVTQEHIVVSTDEPIEGKWSLLPFDNAVIAHNLEQSFVDTEGESTFLLPKSEYLTTTPESLTFLLTNGDEGYQLVSTLNAPQAQQSRPLILLVSMAFLGGLILNLMPCVLPILAIKAMSINQSQSSALDKLAYLLGVVFCFNLFALVIVLIRRSGEAVGWGFHMQEPAVVATLAFLFLYIALFLINIAPQGNRLTSLGQGAIKGTGRSVQFMTGVLAVVVASPCTAPFMAAALGIAMVSPAPTVFLLFSSLALGFALPLTLLYFVPQLSALLPKPGLWMERVRQFLAFPMLATVIWLVWLYLQQTNANAQLLLLSGLLFFAMVLWIANQYSGLKAGIAYLLALAAIAVPLMAPYDTSSHQQNMAEQFNQQRLTELKNNDQVIFVNMTADWCITCKVNEQVALSNDQVIGVLRSESVHYIEGDWTNKNKDILTYLNQYARAGVPLYVVYAGNQSHQILPQILTPEIVLTAINKAKQEIKNEY